MDLSKSLDEEISTLCQYVADFIWYKVKTLNSFLGWSAIKCSLLPKTITVFQRSCSIICMQHSPWFICQLVNILCCKICDCIAGKNFYSFDHGALKNCCCHLWFRIRQKPTWIWLLCHHPFHVQPFQWVLACCFPVLASHTP